MELEDKEIAIIEKYLLKQMSEEEVSSFESRLSSNTAFAKEVEVYKKLMQSSYIVGRSSLKEQLKSIEASILKNEELKKYEPKNPPKGFKGKLILGIIIASIVGLIIYFSQRGEKSILQTPVSTPVDIPLSKVVADTIDEDIEESIPEMISDSLPMETEQIYKNQNKLDVEANDEVLEIATETILEADSIASDTSIIEEF